MKSKSFLDSIEVPSPCDKSWSEMIGDNQKRLCSHCDTTIYNLSEMSATEVTKLLSRNNSKVCVRLTRDVDGKVQTSEQKFHQIKRKTKIVASVLSITLALTTVSFTQTNKTKSSIENQTKTQQNLLTLTIADSNGAVISKAQVKIINLETKKEQTGRSNENGELQFVIENFGDYEIIVDEILGFKQLKKTIKLTKENLEVKLQLDISNSVVGTIVESDETSFILGDVAAPPNMMPVNIHLNLKDSERFQKLQQKTSQISFTIYDSNNAVIPNAEVKLIHEKTKQEFIANANEQGVAYFAFLPRGRYQVKSSAKGFKSSTMSVIVKEEIEPNIKMILDVGIVIGIFVVNWYEVPIFNSIIQQDFEVVKNYISSGKNVNIKDTNDDTMLHVAAKSGNTEMIKLLLDAGANVNAKNKNGITPILMIDVDNEKETLEILKLFISKGADVNVQNKDEDNQTLLMLACDNDNLEIVKLLLEAGANTNLKDSEGETALMKTDSEEIKKILRLDKNEKKEIFAEFSGTIRDPNGAIINGAKVTLKNLKTKKLVSVISNTEGVYKFSQIEFGDYDLKIKFQGFETFHLRKLVINSESKAIKDVILNLENKNIVIGLLEL